MTTHKSDSIEDRRQKPWAMVEIELLREPRITPQCKALYGLLISYGPQSIFPGQETLAECLGTSRQTVKRWLDDLRLQGLIDWENRTGTSNKYYILGYANFKRGDVAPMLQGCNTSITGDVTPTLHDLDPLILNQELEEPPLADSPVEDSHPDPSELCRPGLSGLLPVMGRPKPAVDDSEETAALFKKPKPPSHEPAEQGKARRRHELGTDPLQVAAVVAQNRAAVAHPDGGDARHDIDGWMDRPVREWCAFIRLPYENSHVAYLATELSHIAVEVHASAEQTGEAIRKMTLSPSCEWLRTAHDPKHTGFAGTLLNVLNGQELPEGKANGASGGRNEQPQVDQAVAETMASLFDERGVRIRRE